MPISSLGQLRAAVHGLNDGLVHLENFPKKLDRDLKHLQARLDEVLSDEERKKIEAAINKIQQIQQVFKKQQDQIKDLRAEFATVSALFSKGGTLTGLKAAIAAYEAAVAKLRILQGEQLGGHIQAYHQVVAPLLPSAAVQINEVNLNEYPPDCLEFGELAIQNRAPAMGDMHACAPKLIYFALANGMARFKLSGSETNEGLYEEFVRLCEKFAKMDNVTKQDLKDLKKLIGKLEFADKATMLLIGDILADRNGNDAVTALLFQRMKECGARPVVLLSNHDGAFINWFAAGMSGHLYDPNEQFTSANRMKQLIDNGLMTKEEVTQMFNESYFNNLVLFYYDVDQNGAIHNISSHAPLGEREIYQMFIGMLNYLDDEENKGLFPTDGKFEERIQKLRKLLIGELKLRVDSYQGLSDKNLKEIMDLMNEVLHFNAIKPDKKDLERLMNLGVEGLTDKQKDGYGIRIKDAPFYAAMWKRDQPAKAPEQTEGRTYRNGHTPNEANWTHNNENLDNPAGKGADYMQGLPMNYGVAGVGYEPMQSPGARVEATQAQTVNNNNNNNNAGSSFNIADLAKTLLGQPKTKQDSDPTKTNTDFGFEAIEAIIKNVGPTRTGAKPPAKPPRPDLEMHKAVGPYDIPRAKALAALQKLAEQRLAQIQGLGEKVLKNNPKIQAAAEFWKGIKDEIETGLDSSGKPLNPTEVCLGMNDQFNGEKEFLEGEEGQQIVGRNAELNLQNKQFEKGLHEAGGLLIKADPSLDAIMKAIEGNAKKRRI